MGFFIGLHFLLAQNQVLGEVWSGKNKRTPPLSASYQPFRDPALSRKAVVKERLLLANVVSVTTRSTFR